MIKSFTSVDENGNEFGGEVSIKFREITAVKKMYKWEYLRLNEDEPRQEVKTLVPGCCTIYVGKEDFDVKIGYDEMLALWKEHHEMYG